MVATSVDGTPKIVRNNYNGFLVKPRDYESLAKKISYALDINAQEKMREAISKTYNEEFSIKILEQKYLSFYKNIKNDIN
ncbi:glycosyltransferase family 4 protein [Lactobacillus equicursoris]|uniref:Glycosyltransferase family 4 protein n=1 Tax=Lactobacillus equicursoris TaxID=420645 RepID=A0A844FMK9_9LACO|nr:glycosyltransferase family 4 protein [Lactobacillus equicursoris]